MSSSFNKGFTLVEMLVVVSIIVIISTVVMINFPQYSAHQQLQLAAQDVLTTIRETQLYGIAVRGETVGSQIVYKSQGIYIDPDFILDPSVPESLRPKAGTYFMSYIDADHTIGNPTSLVEGFNQPDCLPNSLGGPCVKRELSEPIRITRLCVSYDGTEANELCSDGTNPITAIDILFQRPEPEPKIWAFDASGNRRPGLVKYAKIFLEAIAENNVPINTGTKIVWLHNTGQVSVIGEESKASGGK